MFKKVMLFLPVLLLAGCTTGTFTRLTPNLQPRNSNDLYAVEVAFNSDRQAIRWDSIRPYVVVNGDALPMRPVPLVKNRWEGVIPVQPGQTTVIYRFKFDYLCNSFGTTPQPNSESSRNYVLKVADQ